MRPYRNVGFSGYNLTHSLQSQAKIRFAFHFVERNEATCRRLRDALSPLQTRKAFLSSYGGEKIPVLGAVMAPVKYKSQQKE